MFKKETELSELILNSSRPGEKENPYLNEEKNQLIDEEKKSFFSRKIDFSNMFLNLDRSPAIVNPSTNLCKVHYLVIALGVSTVFVVDKGTLMGVIKKNHLLGLNNNKSYAN